MYIITNVYGVLVFANYEMKKSANQIQCIWICTFFSFAFRHNNRTMLIHSGMVFATIYTAIKAILTACDGLYNRRHNTRMSSHIACLFKIQIHSIPSALSSYRSFLTNWWVWMVWNCRSQKQSITLLKIFSEITFMHKWTSEMKCPHPHMVWRWIVCFRTIALAIFTYFSIILLNQCRTTDFRQKTTTFKRLNSTKKKW